MTKAEHIAKYGLKSYEALLEYYKELSKPELDLKVFARV